MHNGFIIVHRKILDWEWYQDSNTFRLFFHCLLKCNHTEKKWQGHTIERGSFITSTNQLSTETGLSVQQVKTSLKKLESTNEITKHSTTKNTVIKVVNYDLYQGSNLQDNQQVNNEQLTNNLQGNQPITTTNNENNAFNNENNVNNENNISLVKEEKPKKAKLPKHKYGEYGKVQLTDNDYNRLLINYDNNEMLLLEGIRILDTWLETTGNVRKNHYAVMNDWVKERVFKERNNKPKQSLKDIPIEMTPEFMNDFYEVN